MYKFRGAVKLPFPNKTARWAYGSLIELNGLSYIVPDDAEVNETGDLLDGFVEVHPASVGMWTGREDVYGGDIIRVKLSSQNMIDPPSVSHEVYEVVWSKEFLAWMFCNEEELLSAIDIDDLEIIGNKTDDPELLKGQSNE